ncbi:conserved hypothetical protein [Pseudomonas knackmussii B13]|uniref:Uncharacterized protein n=1 Tax=Pseudomonas knackmussii (strain DSM 6978 / CCUG 54928 / LMG 23759 / B13) TaxID=1301098 RepID=A0A024HPL4_PSEKB|nr:hypothetical protein [Pseudomonas knackmussii]CDF86368.1 conserved hypothetical protein [Pseudomonas knackmussii B13]
MLMKHDHFLHLTRIWSRPGLTLRTQLLIARRVARQFDQFDKVEGVVYSRASRSLKNGLPFTKGKLDKLEHDYRTLRKMRKAGRLAIGEWLMPAGAEIEAELGVDGICDVLAINPVHRAEAAEAKPSQAVDFLVFVAGLEDSATHFSARRPSPWKEGPLFHCVLELMMKFTKENPGALGDPFAPDGPLYGASKTLVRNDGTIETQRAALTLHSRDGTARVIERKPEVSR